MGCRHTLDSVWPCLKLNQLCVLFHHGLTRTPCSSPALPTLAPHRRDARDSRAPAVLTPRLPTGKRDSLSDTSSRNLAPSRLQAAAGMLCPNPGVYGLDAG
eukprot:62454-Rhodomonas_salina.2